MIEDRKCDWCDKSAKTFLFIDSPNGGFFYICKDHEDGLVSNWFNTARIFHDRKKSNYD